MPSLVTNMASSFVVLLFFFSVTLSVQKSANNSDVASLTDSNLHTRSTYYVNNTSNNFTCLTLKVDLKFVIHQFVLNIMDAEVDSTCPTDENARIIELRLIADEKNNVTFIFERNPEDNSTQVSNITLVHIDDKGEFLDLRIHDKFEP